MPTKSIGLRIDEVLLKYLQERAEREHHTLSNLIVSILMDSMESKDGEKLPKKHGRLIDADLALKLCEEPSIYDLTDVPEFLNYLPTVVRASGENDYGTES